MTRCAFLSVFAILAANLIWARAGQSQSIDRIAGMRASISPGNVKIRLQLTRPTGPTVVVNGDGGSDFHEEVRRAVDRLLKQQSRRFFASELSIWPEPASLNVRFDATGGSGATEFLFQDGKLGFPIEAKLKGRPDDILADVLPHEVCHMVLASGFQRAVPRWLDEGLAVRQETLPARQRQWAALTETLASGQALPLRVLFEMEDYPADLKGFYSQAWSIVEFLATQSDEAYLCELLADRFEQGQWNWRKYFGCRNASSLQQSWEDWVQSGGPLIKDKQTVQRPLNDECRLPWRWSRERHAWQQHSTARNERPAPGNFPPPVSLSSMGAFPGTLSFSSRAILH